MGNNCIDEPGHHPDHIEDPVIQGIGAKVCLVRVAMTQAYRVFVDALSVASRFNRFHSVGHSVNDSVIEQLTNVDQLKHVALAAIDGTDPSRMIAEVRYVVDEQCNAEWAIAVADQWQRKGLGFALGSILLSYARTHHVARVWGTVHRSNKGMQALARRLGFAVRYYQSDSRLLLIERGM